MFQVAFRRLAPKRWHHYGLMEGNRFTRPSNFRLISSIEPAYSLQPQKKHHAIQLGDCRINYSNIQIIHGGYSRSFPLLHHQRRWFSDEKPAPPPKKAQEEPGRLSQIVPALRQRATNFNTGDLMSVYTIAVLILIIIFSPFIASQMRKSDNLYEEIETDDPVAHTEKNYRRLLMDSQLAEHILERLWGKEIDHSHDLPKPRIITSTTDLIQDVLRSEVVQSAVAHLVASVLNSDQFQEACQMLLKSLWHDLVNDPETISQVVQLLQNAIQNNDIQRSIRKLVLQIINDKEVYDELTKLLVRLGQDKEVLKATQSLLTESAHNALNDPEILDHSMEFATDVVGDDIVQRTSGEALRNTVTYAVRPGLSTFLSLVGVALFLFGLSALANSRATDQEALIVEKAMSTVARNIQSTAVEGIGALLALPVRLLSACFTVLSAVVTFPLKLMHHGVSIVGKSGGAIVKSIAGAVYFVVGIPGSLFRASVSLIGRVGKSTTESVSRAFFASLASISAFCVGIGSALVSPFTSLLSSALRVSSETLSSVIAGVGKAVERCDRWIEHVFDSTARASSHAVDAVVNVVVNATDVSLRVVTQASDASLRVVMQASDAVVGWVSKLVDFVTRRGENGTSTSAP